MAISREVVLLAGSFCNERLWSHQQTALMRAGFTVHCPRIDHLTSIEAMDDSIIEAFPRMYGLAGLSMGGMVALQIAIRRPDLVQRLILLSTRAQALPRDEFGAECEHVFRALDEGRMEELADWAAKGWTPEHVHSNQKLMDEIKRMSIEAGAQANRNTMLACRDFNDLRSELHKIQAKTLIVCGREDLLTTPVHLHEELADNIPNAKLVVLKGCGQVVTLEKPEAVERLMVDWFEERELQWQ